MLFIRALVGAVVLWNAPLIAAEAAVADGGCLTYYVSHTIAGVTTLEAHEYCPGTTTTTIDTTDPGRTDLGRDPICVATALSLGEDSASFCDSPGNDDGTVEITPGAVRAAMAHVRIPAAVLEVQPPGGRTLVNFDTNFFTAAQGFDQPLTLLGAPVVLRLTPSVYTFNFGDGKSLQSKTPGAPYPQLAITHRYTAKGHFEPSVDTTWTGQFSVRGGPFRDVPGTVLVPGPAVGLVALTATPTLVGYE